MVSDVCAIMPDDIAMSQIRIRQVFNDDMPMGMTVVHLIILFLQHIREDIQTYVNAHDASLSALRV